MAVMEMAMGMGSPIRTTETTETMEADTEATRTAAITTTAMDTTATPILATDTQHRATIRHPSGAIQFVDIDTDRHSCFWFRKDVNGSQYSLD